MKKVKTVFLGVILCCMLIACENEEKQTATSTNALETKSELTVSDITGNFNELIVDDVEFNRQFFYDGSEVLACMSEQGADRGQELCYATKDSDNKWNIQTPKWLEKVKKPYDLNSSVRYTFYGHDSRVYLVAIKWIQDTNEYDTSLFVMNAELSKCEKVKMSESTMKSCQTIFGVTANGELVLQTEDGLECYDVETGEKKGEISQNFSDVYVGSEYIYLIDGENKKTHVMEVASSEEVNTISLDSAYKLKESNGIYHVAMYESVENDLYMLTPDGIFKMDLTGKESECIIEGYRYDEINSTTRKMSGFVVENDVLYIATALENENEYSFKISSVNLT